MRCVVALMVLVAGVVWAAPSSFAKATADRQVEVVKSAFTQGGFVVGKVVAGATLEVNGVRVPVGEDGMFVLGFDRFAKPVQAVEVCEGKDCRLLTWKLAQRVYKVQNVKGVPANTVNPSPDEVKQTEEDSAAIAAARKNWSSVEAFAGDFVLPIESQTSGVFGSRRIYNGEERSWHKGHDLAAATGTPVRAPADGLVRLARSTFMSGNLVIVDHGHYVTSLYAHLDSMAVKAGDVVKQGDMLGKVGTTGRSTGPHLHWGMNWKNIAIDPILWVGHTYGQEEGN